MHNLKKHSGIESEVWLVFPKKASGKVCILYSDAVEEALWFGWIDSKVKNLAKKSSIQRFSPRNTKAAYLKLTRRG